MQNGLWRHCFPEGVSLCKCNLLTRPLNHTWRERLTRWVTSKFLRVAWHFSWTTTVLDSVQEARWGRSGNLRSVALVLVSALESASLSEMYSPLLSPLKTYEICSVSGSDCPQQTMYIGSCTTAPNCCFVTGDWIQRYAVSPANTRACFGKHVLIYFASTFFGFFFSKTGDVQLKYQVSANRMKLCGE